MKAATVPLPHRLFRGEGRLRIALTGLPGAGVSSILRDIEGAGGGVEPEIRIGFDQARVARVEPDRLGTHAPDVIVQVLDATALERHLDLTVRLLELGRPLVLAVNRMDEARDQGLHIGTKMLSRCLGVPVVATIGTMGYGLRELFAAAAEAARGGAPSPTFHPGGILAKIATRPGGVHAPQDWRYWLDELFLSPRFGLLGSLAVFAAVLYVVLDLSARIDALTSARLVAWISGWQPATTAGVVGRAVADGLIGLVGILVPYMVPLVLLLVLLEQTGIMARIAFAVDRVFHRLGVHGSVALPLLLGLGCNVPALSAVATSTRGAERTTASLLVTFVPCSARSAIILALAGRYLGAWGVLAVFAVSGAVIAVTGQILRWRQSARSAGQILEIPPYALPRPRALVAETWLRTKDVVTIVTPLLVAGSVFLALLNHWGSDRWINLALLPVTEWWLGLPAVLGVPLLFGVLRKELSLLMIYQALGGFAVDAYLTPVQIFTFLVFLTLYLPCVSTFAVLTRTVGLREALRTLTISIGAALAVAGALRFALLAIRAA